MGQNRPILAITLAGWVVALGTGAPARAQDAGADGAKLFKTQCATCHTLDPSEGQRQGPTLAHVYGRKIGSVADYHYTSGYKEAGDAGKTWEDDNLDAYLTSPQKMFPGSTMAYRQSKPEVRHAIIAYLKEQK